MSEPQHPPVPPSAQPHPLAGGPQHALEHAVPQYPAASPNPAPQVAAPSYAPVRPAGGEHLGRTALILAVVFLAFGLLKALAVPFAYIQSGYTPFSAGVFLGIGDVIVFLGAATALTLGLVAVRRPRQHLLGGVAIGIAAAQLAGILATWLSNAFLRLF